MNDKRILVLGIGNLLWADEGFGVRCVEALNAGWSFPSQVTRWRMKPKLPYLPPRR